ncbi:hypothetical protein COCSADRAFT_288336 [Bipolaris sorokiniana ND90Pr]|uniref:Uncharacterized protein n=1 Tax=Cochliobolus sativus (strain ND90Pr / ATCC 201652) TaxID=665912 RepID=M2SJF0_COCSN|nr:uncharacterized protein COCSADRAFT_288336 [Bipolaris sorokiniana ND90Pr]EMD67318.1 hypothetical protein COCSADRAFT_288336 [Bipolaris sorokiniana ND90Pr]
MSIMVICYSFSYFPLLRYLAVGVFLPCFLTFSVASLSSHTGKHRSIATTISGFFFFWRGERSDECDGGFLHAFNTVKRKIKVGWSKCRK